MYCYFCNHSIGLSVLFILLQSQYWYICSISTSAITVLVYMFYFYFCNHRIGLCSTSTSTPSHFKRHAHVSVHPITIIVRYVFTPIYSQGARHLSSVLARHFAYTFDPVVFCFLCSFLSFCTDSSDRIPTHTDTRWHNSCFHHSSLELFYECYGLFYFHSTFHSPPCRHLLAHSPYPFVTSQCHTYLRQVVHKSASVC